MSESEIQAQGVKAERIPWHKVEMTGPAVVGLLFMIGGGVAAGLAGVLAGLVAMVALAWYRIATR